MAWNRVETMDQRARFVLEVTEGCWTKRGLCAKYGISRPTGDKWLKRYEQEGLAGLGERSRAPRSCPHRTSGQWEERIIRARLRHPHWGPRKLYALLWREYEAGSLPAPSTIGGILKRRGLVRGRRRRRQGPSTGRGALREAAYPNAVWAIDYKGWFRTGDGRRCDPLTITDLYSRFVVALLALPDQSTAWAYASLRRVFRAYGMPEVIRSDNGSPFASRGVAGLSRLSVWWVQLGIRPEYIDPGSPHQNAEHERMHGTLKYEACRPASANRRAQQRRFNAWREEFNTVRPHEALAMAVPASRYDRSPRVYTGRLRPPEYPGYYQIRRVRQNGEIKWKGRRRFIGEALRGMPLGLEPTPEDGTRVYFADILLGNLYDADPAGIRPAVPAPRSRLTREAV